MLPFGSLATELAFADVTGENGPDLVMLANDPWLQGSFVWVYRNLGDGQFEYVARGRDVPGYTLRGLGAADLDNDGDIDVFAAADDCNDTGGPSDAFVVFENTTTEPELPRFTAHIHSLDIPGDVAPGDIAIGDFFALQPGQTLTDFVTPNPLSDSFTLVKNLGNLQFASVRTDAPLGCALPDWLFETSVGARFGADSYWDFAAVEPDERFVGIFLGDGRGSFQSYCDDSSLGYRIYTGLPDVRAHGIAVGSLNGNNNPDLAIALRNPNPDLAPWNGAVAVLLGRTDGTFQAPSADEAYTYPLGNAVDGSAMLEIVDLNNDGFGDIVVSNFYSDDISVLINKLLVTLP